MKICRLLILFLFTGLFIYGQSDSLRNLGNSDRKKKPDPENDWRKKIFLGGNLGLSFGNITFIDISPLVGYKVTDKFHLGVGAIYNYYSYKDTYYGTNYVFRTSLYGGRCFARYYVMENIFLQTGWDKINRDDPYILGQRVWVDNYLVGGGVRYPVGDRLSFVAVGLWNLNASIYSPYPNPIIQLGIMGGF